MTERHNPIVQSDGPDTTRRSLLRAAAWTPPAILAAIAAPAAAASTERYLHLSFSGPTTTDFGFSVYQIVITNPDPDVTIAPAGLSAVTYKDDAYEVISVNGDDWDRNQDSNTSTYLLEVAPMSSASTLNVVLERVDISPGPPPVARIDFIASGYHQGGLLLDVPY